jgi:hypothetical protein
VSERAFIILVFLAIAGSATVAFAQYGVGGLAVGCSIGAVSMTLAILLARATRP